MNLFQNIISSIIVEGNHEQIPMDKEVIQSNEIKALKKKYS